MPPNTLMYLERPLSAVSACGACVQLAQGLVVKLVRVWESPAIPGYVVFEFETKDAEIFFVEELAHYGS